MRFHSAATVFFAAASVVVACGGQFEGYGGQSDSGLSCTIDNVRLCGGTCGSVVDCAGGCVPLVSGDGSSSSYGVCFADLPDLGQTPCAVCDTGQGCVQRSAGAYACVPLEVCGALRAVGANDVCWYADKSPYDGRAIDIPTTCPDSLAPLHQDHAMCGGACGVCNPQLGSLARCLGQGPTHPVGICATPNGPTVNPYDAKTYPRCVVVNGSAACGSGYRCAVFPAPPAEITVAANNGVCIIAQDCTALTQALPGGLECY